MSPTKFVNESEGKEELNVHYLPFKIDYEGPAKVLPMFTSTAEPHPEIPDKVLKNHFRGRPLNGTKLELPAEYTAFVATQEMPTNLMKKEGEGEEKVRLLHKFQDMTYWEWDKTPSSMDRVMKLQDWLKLSQVIHEPIPIGSKVDQD